MSMGHDMASYRVVKWFSDYAEDIEAVNIHYALTALGAVPDWDRFRVTYYMPLSDGHIRMKELRLPQSISSPSGEPSGRYNLHYYFEVFRGGDREYSPLYTEEIATDETSESASLTGPPGEVGKKVVGPGVGVERE